MNALSCFLVIHDAQSSRSQWTANIPTKIPALQGSCVVIPCTYTYPKPTSNKILNRWRGFWRKGNKIVTTSLPKWKLSEEYKKRTQFLGDLPSRNCTMLLDGIRKTDVGPFYFRIEMPQYKSFSYTKNTVSIDVIREYCVEYFNNFEGNILIFYSLYYKSCWYHISTLQVTHSLHLCLWR